MKTYRCAKCGRVVRFPEEEQAPELKLWMWGWTELKGKWYCEECYERIS